MWNDNGAGGGTAANGIKDGTEPGVSGVALSLFVDANDDNVPDSPGSPLATGVRPTAAATTRSPGLRPATTSCASTRQFHRRRRCWPACRFPRSPRPSRRTRTQRGQRRQRLARRRPAGVQQGDHARLQHRAHGRHRQRHQHHARLRLLQQPAAGPQQSRRRHRRPSRKAVRRGAARQPAPEVAATVTDNQTQLQRRQPDRLDHRQRGRRPRTCSAFSTAGARDAVERHERRQHGVGGGTADRHIAADGTGTGTDNLGRHLQQPMPRQRWCRRWSRRSPTSTPTPATRRRRSASSTWRVNDGLGGIDIETVFVNVVAVNDAPTLTGDGVLAAIPEDTTNPAGGAARARSSAARPSATRTRARSRAWPSSAPQRRLGKAWQYSTNEGTNWFAIGSVADGGTASRARRRHVDSLPTRGQLLRHAGRPVGSRRSTTPTRAASPRRSAAKRG